MIGHQPLVEPTRREDADGVLLILGDALVKASEIAEVLRLRGNGSQLLEYDWSVQDAAELAALNRAYELAPVAGIADREPLLEAIGGSEPRVVGLFTSFFPISAELLNLLPNLRYVATVRSGVENIDIAAAAQRGIKVVNNPGRNAEVVAEFSVGLMLATRRGIACGHAALMRGEWAGIEFRERLAGLSGAVVGIVGYGHVGRCVGSLLVPFGATVLAFDPYMDAFAGDVTRVTELDQLLERSDIVTLHARAAANEPPLLGEGGLERIGPDGTLINTARAELVDEEALVKVLQDGRLGGAGLDVFSMEPLSADHPLLHLPNVTVTPHLAGRVRGVNALAIRRLADRVGQLA
jgi:D-3-phosphoglycerate dehydrogenase